MEVVPGSTARRPQIPLPVPPCSFECEWVLSATCVCLARGARLNAALLFLFSCASTVASQVEFEVEEIVGHRVIDGGQYEYFVKWIGFDHLENTWEPKENLLVRPPPPKRARGRTS